MLVDPALELAVLYVEGEGVPTTVEVIRPSSSEAVRRRLSEGATRVAVASFDPASLAAVVDDFEPGRIAQLSARLRSPPPAAGPAELIEGGVFRAAALPEGTIIRSAALGDGAADPFTTDEEVAARVRATVTLLVPSSLEPCAPPNGDLRVFANVPDEYVVGMRWFTEDLILVHGVVRLLLVRRGEGPVAFLEAADLTPGPREVARFGWFALDPRPLPNGHATLWASACSSTSMTIRDCVEGSGRLLRLEIGADGFSSVRTATVVTSGPGYLEPVVDALGRVLLINGPSRFHTLEGDPPVFTALDAPPVGPENVHPDSAVATDDLARPFLVSFKSTVHLLDWQARRWVTWPVGGVEIVATYGLTSALDPVTGDLEIWTAGSRGRMSRKLAGRDEFVRVDPVLPLRLAACANAERRAVDHRKFTHYTAPIIKILCRCICSIVIPHFL